jgi:hypothetical protein
MTGVLTMEAATAPRRGAEIMARRKERDHGDSCVNSALNAENLEAWCLIRNDENVPRMVSDVRVGSQPVADPNESTCSFVDLFSKAPRENRRPHGRTLEQAAGASSGAG